ncbi:HIRAN domain-containing protein [Methanobrevibacter sp. DSM 116169]|uniref:HIRAN domain-containing protein n=1 Tax=Methanobrevibacter sp. DSM 116169 TaxID=3242727 RepID=UPI0038FC352D
MNDKNDLIEIDEKSKNIVNLIHSGEIKSSFIETIFLTSDTVAGTSYIEDIIELEPKLAIGDKLDFIREMNNPYDDNAILVRHKGNKIGYFPMQNNEILSNLMDAGKLIYGIIKSKNFHDEWLKIDLEVFLEE